MLNNIHTRLLSSLHTFSLTLLPLLDFRFSYPFHLRIDLRHAYFNQKEIRINDVILPHWSNVPIFFCIQMNLERERVHTIYANKELDLSKKQDVYALEQRKSMNSIVIYYNLSFSWVFLAFTSAFFFIEHNKCRKLVAIEQKN
jgi:hypothetical protein